MTESLTRPQAAAAVAPIGWRVLLATLAASVPVASLGAAAAVARAVVEATDADPLVRVDLRPDRVELVITELSERAVALAGRATLAVREHGAAIADPAAGPRPVQALELAIDALDIPKIVPFWAAVLGYVAHEDEVVDPAGQGPSVWFQQLDVPRPQRNRIHFDITVAHDEAPRRVAAALAAGGHLLSDAAAKSFWILADAEGNEICVCTWQDRD